MRFTGIASCFARQLSFIAVVGALAAGTASSVGAEDAAAPQPGKPDMTEILLRDGVAVPDLLRMASVAADVPILWSDSDKAITMRKLMGAQRLLVPKAQVFDAVRDLLASQEISFVPIGTRERPVYIAIDARMLQNQFLLKLRPEHVDMDDATAARLEGRSGLFIETTIRVPGVENLRDVRTALARLITGQNVGSVQEIPSAQAFSVTDYAPNVVAIYRFLKALPPKPEPKVEFFLLSHARAADVESVLDELLGARAVAVGGPTPPGTEIPMRGELPRFVSDVATNQVIVVGTPAQIELARQIVEHADVPPRPVPTPAGGR